MKIYTVNGTQLGHVTTMEMYTKAGYREKFAMEHGICREETSRDGRCYYTFEKHPDAEYEYTDWIGAKFDRVSGRWVN